MTTIILHGCNGRMGKIIAGLCADDPDATIVAGVDSYAENKNEFPVFARIGDCDVKADVVIDFSSAGALDDLLDWCVERKVPAVLCSTGYSEEQLRKVEAASGQIAVLKSANMSLGINTLMDLLQKAAKVLAPEGFDVEIVERHHNQKLDAPSGTALALADSVNEAMEGCYEYVYDRSGRREKRGEKELGISAVRGGTIVGEHEVIFAGTDEVIKLKHTAYSRAVFGKGALAAAKFLHGKEKGYFTMKEVIAEA